MGWLKATIQSRDVPEVPTSGIADKFNHHLFELEDRKRRDNCGSMSNRQCMDMDDDACLSALAAAVVADPLIFGLRRSLEEAIAQLRLLAGVGQWTAQYIAMRELREPDAFPAADIGLMRAIGDWRGVLPSPAELLARAERWRPWRAYAALHPLGVRVSRVPDD
jgi:3-methyladenine DNA glycosylase/8-oxoguanine DNA glycosylase